MERFDLAVTGAGQGGLPAAVFFHGPGADWQEMPEPLIISGYTVIREREALKEELSSMLEVSR